MRLVSKVKINLGLQVIGKRPDGYHDICTVFYPCSAYGDLIDIERAGESSVCIEGPCYTGWDPQKDLTFKAWELLHKDFGIGPVSIHLQKNSPVGAGLGSGSSDAVEALKGLSELFSLGLSQEQMLSYAASLGSDCPFFVLDTPSLGEGRGEVLTPIDLDLSGYEIRIEIPQGESVSTKEAYGGLKLKAREGREDLVAALKGPVSRWKDLVSNDFEDSVFCNHPAIAEVKDKMYKEGALYASMTGSGAAVYGIFTR